MSAPSARSGHREHKQLAWRFNPFEIAVCGYKNSGKTTLLEGVAQSLAGELRLAYLKHDAHHFAMDYPGKDTDRLRDAGASSVYIAGTDGFGHLGDHNDSDVLAPYPFLAANALLVEGYKASGMSRIMLLDEPLAIVDDPAWFKAPPVAVVHPWRMHSAEEETAHATVRGRFGDLPWLCRDDIAGITDFIRELWKKRVPALHGLVLTGGQSTRMGRDKALLDYHGCTQIEYGVRLLEGLCTDVRVSCRPDQDDESARRRHPTLTDRFLGMGPTGGLLTALADDACGESSWLVLACDLPRVNAAVLEHLVSARAPFQFATAFRGNDGFPEPLCAIWEPKAYPRLLQFLGMGYECPRKCLIQSPIRLVDAPLPDALDNGNNPEDLRRIGNDLDPRS
jgi:molybdenum cofactor guanylyltransferase